MERLTIKYNECYVPKKLCTVNRFGEVDGCDGCVEHCEEQGTIDEQCPRCAVQECFNRLGAYEDTGITPEKLDIIEEEYSKMAKELAELRRRNRWIPVSERLPTREEYLKNDGRFILDDGNRRYQGLFDIYDGKFKFVKHVSGLKYELVDDNCVIAWQPLPESYKNTITSTRNATKCNL